MPRNTQECYNAKERYGMQMTAKEALRLKRLCLLKIFLRDHETTILHILGAEILGLFQNDLLSNFKLEMTTEHIPAL